MANWKKIISSGSNAHLLNITSSGGVQIGTTAAGTVGTDNVLVRDASTGKINYVTQASIGGLGSSVNAFATMSADGNSLIAANSTDTLNFTAGPNVGIAGDSATKKITISAVTKSAADITTILSASLTDGTHKNITINESGGVFSITGSSDIFVYDTIGQNGIDLTYNTSNASLTASLSGLGTTSSPQFADITSTGNISASGFISASALHVVGDTTIGGNLTLDGNFKFDGYNFETSDLLNHSGSNIFGSGSAEPSSLTHKFTGSLSVTGSGITLAAGGIFYGDGSGLTNISATSLPNGILSSSAQIASDISGAYQADDITIQSSSGLFSAKTAAVTTGGAALATGTQIAAYINTESGSLKDFVASNYITEVRTSDANSGLTGGVTSGTADLQIDINSLAPTSPAATQQFAFNDVSDNVTKKATLGALAAFITGSTQGTVTSVTTGLGLTGGDITTTGTINVGAGNGIAVSVDGVSLTNDVTLTGTITAVTGSFTYLKVTGETTIIESENLFIADNFMTLNSNLGASTPSEDAGITVNRGSQPNANLYWEENESDTAAGNERWALSKANSITTTAIPDAYITSISSSTASPSTAPSYGGSTNGFGNMHVDTATGEIWMYV